MEKLNYLHDSNKRTPTVSNKRAPEGNGGSFLRSEDMPRGGKHVPSTVSSSYRDSPTPQQNTPLLQELYHLIHRVQVLYVIIACMPCVVASFSLLVKVL